MEHYMNVAFELAEEALEDGEVPIGCVFVYDGEIIARGRNTVNVTHNATRHAEINAVDKLIAWTTARKFSLENIMKKTCLYVNVEPCAMCADALYQLALGKVVYGCSNDKFGGFGSVVDVGSFRKQTNMQVEKGVRADNAIFLLKKFYDGENPNAPAHKAKVKKKSSVK